jgi:hypothetical protein
MRARAGVLAGIGLIVGLYYRWGAHAAGADFQWDGNSGGYYNLLARGFAAGHLYLPLAVSPELLAKPDPYDPAINDSLKLYDASLYKGRYYLYHGAGPAVALFLPWRLVTGRDLPENYALFLLCFGGYLFAAGALLTLVRPGALWGGVLLLALGLCQGVPFLLNRTWVYEIAIAGGYCFSSAGLWFVLRGLETRNRWWFAASGLACGLAVASRPHLGLFAVAFGILVLVRAPRALVAFAAPLVLAGLAIGVYNYERFGSATEFGVRYLLTGKNQNRIRAEVANIAPESFYLLAAAPVTDKVFPWIRMAWPPADIPRPKEFFLEPSIGAIWLAPFLPAILLMPLLGAARLPASLLVMAAGGIFLFLASTGFSTQRYEVDFLPMLVLVALAGLGAAGHPVLRRVGALLILAGICVNLAVAVSGPLDEMIRNRPDRYVRLSRMLTPVERYRLRLNAPIELRCPVSGAGTILSPGSPMYRYELIYDGRHLISRRFGSEVRAEVGGVREVAIRFAGGEMIVAIDGVEGLRHRLGSFISAPVELENACSSYR